MAIQLDASSVSDWTNNSTTVTLAHQVSGSQRALIVFVQIATAITPTASVTYAGIPMTAVQSNYLYAASGLGSGAYILLNPPTGINNIVATLSATGSTTNAKVTGLSLTGVRDVSDSKLATALSANMPASIGTKFANDWIITSDVVDGNDTLAGPVGFTQITSNGTAVATVGAGAVAYKGPIASPGVQGFSWVVGSSDNNMAISLVVSAANPPPYKGPVNITLSAGRLPIGGLPSTQSSSQLLRTSSDNLYAVISGPGNKSGTAIQIFKSTNNGTTWSFINYANSLRSSEFFVAAAIDGNNVIHIIQDIFGDTGHGYIQFNTSNDTFQNSSRIDSTSASFPVAIAIDSNNVAHVAFTNGTSIFYANNAGAAWTIVTVAAGNGTFIDIQIDQNNVPQISYMNSTTAVVAAIGDKNNARSFTTASASITSYSTSGGASLAVDSRFNTWVAVQSVNNGPVKLYKHNQTDPWPTWQAPITDGYSGKNVSLATDGTDIYVFYERNAGGIAYDRYDTINGKWLGEQIIQPQIIGNDNRTPSFKPHNPFVKWSQYFNNGDTGANNSGQQTIEYLFDDGSTVYYDKLNTAQISTGYVNFQFIPPAGAATTSTSSTSSSTSTSTSISTSSTSTSTSTSISISTSTSSTSQSTSTSISTSSTSSSTSISTSSTSQSTSTSVSTSTSSTSTSVSTSTSISSTSSSTSISTSSTSSSTSQSTSTSSTSQSTSTSASTSTSSTSTSTSISTSSTSSSTSKSTSTSSTSTSTSTSTSVSTSTSSTSSSTSTSTSTSISTSTSSTSQSTSTSISTSTSLSSTSSSTSTTVSLTTSTSSTSSSTSTSVSTSTSSTSTSLSTSTSSTSSSTSTSISTSTSSTSTSTSVSTSTSISSTSTSQSTSTSKSTSTSSTSQSTSTSISTSTSSTSRSTSTSSTSSSTSSTVTTTSTSSTSSSTSSTSQSSSTSTTMIDINFHPRSHVHKDNWWHHWGREVPKTKIRTRIR